MEQGTVVLDDGCLEQLSLSCARGADRRGSFKCTSAHACKQNQEFSTASGLNYYLRNPIIKDVKHGTMIILQTTGWFCCNSLT